MKGTRSSILSGSSPLIALPLPLWDSRNPNGRPCRPRLQPSHSCTTTGLPLISSSSRRYVIRGLAVLPSLGGCSRYLISITMGPDEPRDLISRNRPRLSQARRRPYSKHSDKNANTSKTVDLPLPFGPIRTVSGVSSLRSILRSARKLRTLRDSIRGGPSGSVLAIRLAYPKLAQTDWPKCRRNPDGCLTRGCLFRC